MNKPYTLAEAEAKLKEINPDLSIVSTNEKSDLAGIYWKGHYTEIAIPKDMIYETRNELYCDVWGYPHRGLDSTIDRVNSFLDRIERDPEYVKDITTPFDYSKLEEGDGSLHDPEPEATTLAN